MKAAEAIGRGIPGADAAPYVEQLRALDSGVQACIDTVPEGERLLVTSHDALGYYARRYGIRVVGTVIPSLSTSGQPSAGEVDALVQTIRDTGVKTIFAESSVNAKVEAAIAAESGDEGRQGAVGGLARARGLGRRDLHRLDRVQHERAGRRLHRQARRTASSMVDLAAPYIQRGLIEVLLLAVIAGVLGTWIVLRRLPFYTHAIGTATFPGLVVAGPWGVPAQLTALVCAIGFGGVLERLQRSKRIDPDAAIGLLLVAALAVGVVLASDVYESGAGVDRLLFGSLIALTPLDLWLDGRGRGGGVGVLRVPAPLVARDRLRCRHGARRRGEDGAGRPRLLVAVAVAVVVAIDAVGALLVTVVLTVPAATVAPVRADAAHAAGRDVRL